MFIGDEEINPEIHSSVPPLSPATPATPTSVACPRCKQENPLAIKFCGKCGIPIGAESLDWSQPRPVEVVCKLCGSSYSGGTKFCGRCGKSLTS
jgi:membrane protease subunit (stomatin/prohibitin family)